MKYSIILPAHNEEDGIKGTLEGLINEFQVDNNDYEIIVVCNNCSDQTCEIAEGFSEQIKIINFPQKIGKGGAILEGIRIARGDIVGFTDADGAYDPKTIKKMIEELESNDCDCVIACRWKDSDFHSVPGSIFRRIGSRVWNALTIVLFNLSFSDTQAGLKFFRKPVLNSINQDFICKDFSFDVELLWKLKKKGFRIREMAVRSIDAGKSTVSIQYMLMMLLSLIKLRLVTLKR